MILKKLAESIRRQDWFVVAIEILIVVIGIFIALQVDDWNQQRKNVALERQYLERMQADFDRLLEVEQGRLGWNAVRVSQAGIVQRALDQQRIDEGEHEQFEQGLFFLGVINHPRLFWGTVEELRSTGNIQLIRDLELRRALTDMETEHEWRKRLLQEYADIARDYRAELYKHYRVVQAPDPSNDVSLEIEYDLNELASNGELRNMITRIAQFQQLVDRNLRIHLGEVEALRDRVAEERRQRFGDTTAPAPTTN